MQRAVSVVRCMSLSQKAATPLQSLDSVWSRQDTTTSTQAKVPMADHTHHHGLPLHSLSVCREENRAALQPLRCYPT